MTLREAYRHVKNIRSIIRPNWGFWRQLIAYEQKIRGTPTVRMVESKWGPEEPVPDVYVAEVKENFGAEQQPQPQVVRATMYTVPKYFARRSKSEHSMSPEHPPVSSTASTMYSGLTSPNRSRPPNVDLYRNAGDISSNTVTISRSPLSTITTFSYKGPPSKIRDALNDRSGLFINNRSDKLIDSLTIDSLARSTRSPFRIL
uniref:Uncharacterized protein n=1 Tax=Romanomermis culicivorax TaxID=13658 RepID=A0A915IKA3_ROMCU